MLLRDLIKKYNHFNPGNKLPDDFNMECFASALCNANPKLVLHPVNTQYLRPSLALSLMTIPTHLRIPKYNMGQLIAEVLSVTGLINNPSSQGDDTGDTAYLLNVLYSCNYDRLSKVQMQTIQSIVNANRDPIKKSLLVQTGCFLSCAIDTFNEYCTTFMRANIPNSHI